MKQPSHEVCPRPRQKNQHLVMIMELVKPKKATTKEYRLEAEARDGLRPITGLGTLLVSWGCFSLGSF